MEKNERFCKDMLNNLYDAVYFVDNTLNITFWNKSAENLTGYSSEEVINSRCSDGILNHIDENGTLICETGCPLSQTLIDGKHRKAEFIMKHKDGHRLPVLIRVSPILDESGAITGVVEIFSDNSNKMVYESQIKSLQRLALLDHSTGLYNRRYMEIKLKSSLAEMQTGGIPAGVILSGIDRMNTVNEKYGKEIGDIVILTLAKTIRANTKKIEYLGRWGGDEFLGIIPGADENDMFTTANSLRAIVEKIKIPTSKSPVGVTISIGATMIKKEDTLISLVERTEELLKFSKISGRNRLSMKTKKIV